MHPVNKIGRVQGNLWRENLIQDAASSSQARQKDAKMDKSTRRFVASRSSDIDGIGTVWPHNLHVSTACVSHLEKVLSNVRQRYGRKPGDNGRSRCTYNFLWNVYVRYSSSCSSSWERLFREITFHQKTTQANTQTVIQCNWEVDQGSERNLWYPSEQMAAVCVANDNLAYWSVQFASANTTSFPIQYCVWEESVQIPSKHGRRRLIGFWINLNTWNWIESMESRWSSSGKNSQDLLHCRSSLRFRKWWLKWILNLSNSKDELSSCQCITTFF